MVGARSLGDVRALSAVQHVALTVNWKLQYSRSCLIEALLDRPPGPGEEKDENNVD